MNQAPMGPTMAAVLPPGMGAPMAARSVTVKAHTRSLPTVAKKSKKAAKKKLPAGMGKLAAMIANPTRSRVGPPAPPQAEARQRAIQSIYPK